METQHSSPAEDTDNIDSSDNNDSIPESDDGPVPKCDMEVLAHSIDRGVGTYRLRAGSNVHYVTIDADVFDEEVMIVPSRLISRLPYFPRGSWTRMQLSRGQEGREFETTITDGPLPGVDAWHHHHVDILSLPDLKYISGITWEATYQGEPVIAKFANFDWDNPRISNETWAYSVIDEYESRHPGQPPIAPAFLGHLTENGRIMGFLLERIEGRFAYIDDLPTCNHLLARLHKMGLIHGNISRYNFMIHPFDAKAPRLLDLKFAEPVRGRVAVRELNVLPFALSKETPGQWVWVAE